MKLKTNSSGFRLKWVISAGPLPLSFLGINKATQRSAKSEFLYASCCAPAGIGIGCSWAGSHNDNNDDESTTTKQESLLSFSLLPSLLLLLILLLLLQTKSKCLSTVYLYSPVSVSSRELRKKCQKEIRYSRWKIGPRFSKRDTVHTLFPLSLRLAKAS